MKDDLFGRALGLDALAAHLSSFGVPATRLPPDTLDPSFFSRDRHLLGLEGSPIDLVSLRLEGSTSILDPLGPSFSFSVNGLPLHGKQVVPIKLHFLLRQLPSNPGETACELEFPRNGIFSRDRSRPRFVGGRLARELSRDEPLLAAIREHVETSEGLSLRVDGKLGVTRIVLARKTKVELSLFADRPLSVDRRLLPEPLFRAVEGIARRLRG